MFVLHNSISPLGIYGMSVGLGETGSCGYNLLFILEVKNARWREPSARRHPFSDLLNFVENIQSL